MRPHPLLLAAALCVLPLGPQLSRAQGNAQVELAALGDAAPASSQPAVANAGYKLSGEKTLRPVRIADDGARTYIEWDPDQALPAVFAVNAQGGEEMVDGYMRAGIYTIDRVIPVLIFRIDKKWAKAVRFGPKR